MPLSPWEEAEVKAIAVFVGEEIEHAVRPLLARIAALEGRGYKGIYQRALTYAVGDEVTADGALYVAIAPAGVNEMPGRSTCWQLCAKNIHAQEKRLPTSSSRQQVRR